MKIRNKIVMVFSAVALMASVGMASAADSDSEGQLLALCVDSAQSARTCADAAAEKFEETCHEKATQAEFDACETTYQDMFAEATAAYVANAKTCAVEFPPNN